jgi:preprotein translocase subunit SecA
MPFWNWLTSSRNVELPDMVWLTNVNRMEGVCKSIQERSTDCDLILITSHFTDRLTELREILNRTSISSFEADHAIRPREIRREFAESNETTILLAPAALLASNDPPIAKEDASHRVTVVAVERHPLRLFDERIEQFAAAIPCQVELQFFVALDDTAMQGFAGEWVRDVLRKLGMQEDEAITSKMIVRHLKTAQRKVEERYESLQGLKRGLALERLREEPPREWKNAAEWLAAHGMEVEAI